MSGNFFTDTIKKDPRYHSTEPINDLKLLEPVFRDKVLQIVTEAKDSGHNLMVFETYRSQELQKIYFDRGVTQLRTVGVHHYGLACDLVKVVAGEPSWDGSFDFLGRLAQKNGLIWGGDWGTPNEPHSFRDWDHVQRCSVPDQSGLFAGDWYPGPDYDPYGGKATPTKFCFQPICRGAQVVRIQQSLGLEADGIYGPQTAAAVAQFQEKHGLTADGKVGPLTWKALNLA